MHPDLFFSAHPIPFFMGQTTTRMILERRGYRCTSIRVVTDFAAGGSDESVFPLASGTPPEIRYPRRSACPSRAFGWSSLTTPWGFPCYVCFPCVHAAANAPVQQLGAFFAQLAQLFQPSPIWQSGRPAHRPFRGLFGVHLRYGLHTRAATVFRGTLNRRLQPFRYLHSCSGCFRLEPSRVGLAPTGKAPPFHGARQKRTFKSRA